MFKGLIDKGKCKLGFHSGEWRYDRPQQCLQVRICERCGTRSEQVEHTWGDWHYLTPEVCDLVRFCSHCGAKEQRVEHTWGDPRYTAAGSCALVNPCTRCGEEKPAGERHTWDQWNYVSDDACRQNQLCSRCNAQSAHARVAHHWEAWQNSAFYACPVRACQHCGEAELQVDSAGRTVTLQAIHSQVMRLTESLTDADQTRAALQSDQNLLLLEVTGRYLRAMAETYAEESQTRKGVQAVQQVLTAARQYGVEATVQALFGQPAPPPPVPAAPTPAAAPPKAAPAAPLKAPPAPAAAARDPLLVGHWRCNTYMGGGSFSMSTDYHMILAEDGQMVTYSHTVSSMSESKTPPVRGRWHGANGLLAISDPTGEGSGIRYEVTGDALFFPDHSERRLWERA